MSLSDDLEGLIVAVGGKFEPVVDDVIGQIDVEGIARELDEHPMHPDSAVLAGCCDVKVDRKALVEAVVEGFVGGGNLAFGDIERARVKKSLTDESFDEIVQGLRRPARFDTTQVAAQEAASKPVHYVAEGVVAGLRDQVMDIVGQAGEVTAPKRELFRWVRDRATLLPQHADAVDRFRAGLVEQGVAADRVDRLVREKSERLRVYRSRMIALTEAARAVQLGQMEAWRQAEELGWVDGSDRKRWVTARDERTCRFCAPLDGVEVGLHGLWQTGRGPVEYPSLVHPFCRCVAILVV